MIPSNWTIYALGGALIAFILLFGYVATTKHRWQGSTMTKKHWLLMDQSQVAKSE